MKFESLTKEELVQTLEAQSEDMAKLSQLKLDIKWLEESLKKRTRELNERIKELECLYGISQLVEAGGPSLNALLQKIAELLPTAWQYPEAACARIIYQGQSFQTRPFRETTWVQGKNIILRGKKAGKVEVFYFKNMPDSEEGPFLAAERRLIDCIAERLVEIILSRKFV